MNHIATSITHSLHELYTPEELKSITAVICRDLLGLDMMELYLRKDTKLSENKRQLLEESLRRLKNHEPIQYVCGTAHFYGMDFHVAPGVLIPRPETEELVDLIIKESIPIHQLSKGLSLAESRRVLDIGTGSGCIAISLSHHMPACIVEAWDISSEALDIARRNNLERGTNVIFQQKDVLTEDFSSDPKYHLIVSNPPYVTEKEKTLMERNVLDWEPGQALFVPDDDPLRFYRRIADMGCDMLVPGGRLYFEVNEAYGLQTAGILHDLGYLEVRIIKDMCGKDRIVTAYR